MSNEFNTSLWTMNDPFTDSAILEEQPDGYAPESDDQRSIASSNSSGRGGDFQGTGILVPWTPGHNRRRSSQSHSSYAFVNSEIYSPSLTTFIEQNRLLEAPPLYFQGPLLHLRRELDNNN